MLEPSLIAKGVPTVGSQFTCVGDLKNITSERSSKNN